MWCANLEHLTVITGGRGPVTLHSSFELECKVTGPRPLTTVADNIVHHPSVKALDAACVEGCDALAAVDPTFPRDQIPKDAMTRACAQFAHDLKQNAPELEKQIEQHARAAEEGIKKGEQKVKDGIKATLNRAEPSADLHKMQTRHRADWERAWSCWTPRAYTSYSAKDQQQQERHPRRSTNGWQGHGSRQQV